MGLNFFKLSSRNISFYLLTVSVGQTQSRRYNKEEILFLPNLFYELKWKCLISCFEQFRREMFEF